MKETKDLLYFSGSIDLDNFEKTWGVYDLKDAVHVKPINDISPHFDKLECPCKVVIEETGGKLLVIHNSYDWREYLEKDKKVVQ